MIRYKLKYMKHPLRTRRIVAYGTFFWTPVVKSNRRILMVGYLAHITINMSGCKGVQISGPKRHR
jgi:hypothetical protein